LKPPNLFTASTPVPTQSNYCVNLHGLLRNDGKQK
jgi:hypothetical protein